MVPTHLYLVNLGTLDDVNMECNGFVISLNSRGQYPNVFEKRASTSFLLSLSEKPD
jgi:hypothetical protein